MTLLRSALSIAIFGQGLAGAWGCSRSPSPSADEKVEARAPAKVAKPEPEADGRLGENCRDWSTENLDALPPLADAPHMATLDEVWRTVVEKHYDPTLGCVDWARMRAIYAEKVAGAEDRGQAFAAINEMLDELDQSHFRLFESSGGDDAMLPTSPAMQVRWIEERLVVVHSEAGGDLGSVPAGAVLQSIEGTDVAALVERTRTRTQDQSESAFAFGVARAAMVALSCPRAGVTKRVEIVVHGGERPEPRVVRCEDPAGELVSLGNLSNVPTRVEHRMLDGTTVGYLAFNVWMLPMIERVRSALADLRGQGMQALVLDLRGNPGGVGPMSVPVARMLLDRSASLGTLKFRDFEQTFNVEPDANPFTGPVALLVDEGTASTSEIFAAGMHDLGRVTIVGGKATAGAALPSVIETLPSGAVLQYVVGDYHSPEGVVVEGKGVAPDLRVNETRADFAAGRDPVLEAAVEQLKSVAQAKE